MYRVLASEVPVQERRAQRTHPEYKKPELMATAPNQVWSWDITRLLGPKKWSYYYLYVWTPLRRGRKGELAAGRLIQQSCLKRRPAPGPDPGIGSNDEPMHRSTSRGARSLSRPQVSDDNPSEAQFKT